MERSARRGAAVAAKARGRPKGPEVSYGLAAEPREWIAAFRAARILASACA